MLLREASEGDPAPTIYICDSPDDYGLNHPGATSESEVHLEVPNVTNENRKEDTHEMLGPLNGCIDDNGATDAHDVSNSIDKAAEKQRNMCTSIQNSMITNGDVEVINEPRTALQMFNDELCKADGILYSDENTPTGVHVLPVSLKL